MVSGATLGGGLVGTVYATPCGTALWSGSSADFPVANSLDASVRRPTFQPGYDAGSPAFQPTSQL